jgi:hypothetical protein
MADSEKVSYQEDVEYHKRLTLPYWVPSNRQNFTEFIQRHFLPEFSKQHPLTKHDFQGEPVVQLHTPQQFVAEYLQDDSPYRGLLLYHGLGSGKSAASIAITEGMPERRVVIMLPASLRGNYLKEIEKFSTIHLSTDYNWVYRTIPGLSNRQQLVNPERSSDFYQLFQELNTGLGLDHEIIPAMLTERRTKVKGKFTYGIWLIQPDPIVEAPHYDDLSPTEQREIDTMLQTVFRYKYQFIHYNAGQTLFKSVFDGVGHDSKEAIRQAVNRMSPKPYENWGTLRINQSNKDAVMHLVANGSIENPFDNKVVVVDEIHNLVSRIIGGGYTGKIIYPLLMKASNAKIIFLSGTPAINNPYELGILFNMLGGEVRVHQFRLVDNTHPNRKQANTLLSNNSNIDFYSVGDDGSILITQNYSFFTNVYTEDGKYLGVSRNEPEYIDRNFPKTVQETFPAELAITTAKREATINSMFPSFNVDTDIPKQIEASKLEFQNLYVDLANNEPKRKEQFKSRIVGMVSFFNETTRTDTSGHSVFPSKIEEDPEKVDLSNYQFIKYSEAREQERELEQKSGKKSSSQPSDSVLADTKSISYFKVISRNCQLFVFPPNLERLWPKDIRKRIEMEQSICENLNQIEIDSEEVCATGLGLSSPEEAQQEAGASSKGATKKQATLEYLTAKDQLLDGLTDDNLNLRSQDQYNIRVLSPKYVDIFQTIEKSPGPALCYSQFRTVEGIEVFTRMLESNGFQPYELGSQVEYQIQAGSRIRYQVSPDVWTTLEVVDIQNQLYGVSADQLQKNLLDIYQENGYRSGEADRKSKTVVRKLTEESKLIQELPPRRLTKSQSYRSIHDSSRKPDLTRRQSTKWGGGDMAPEPLLYLPKISSKGDQQIFNSTYAIWDSSLGQDLLDQFNDPVNKHGQHISVIFITMAGAEGISLYNVRQVHVMEPFWNKVKIDQVIGRARRIDSHANLPAGDELGKNNQRKVHVYQYLGVFTEEQLTGKWGESQDYQAVLGSQMEGLDPSKIADLEQIQQKFQAQISQYSTNISGDNGLTSDETLYDISLRKAKIINGFLNLVRESAMDCTFHRKENMKSNPELAKLHCLDTNTLDSEGSFIQVPGKLIEPVMGRRKTTDKIPRSIGLFQINNEAGIFDISGIIDTKSQIVYNLYAYYGLDPTLGWTVSGKKRQLIPIGTVTIQGSNLTGNLFHEFARITNQSELQRYDAIESARRKVAPETGLPQPGKEEDEWRRAIRREYLLAQQPHNPPGKDTAPPEKPDIDVSQFLSLLNITTWPISPKQLLEQFNKVKQIPENLDRMAQIKMAYGTLRKLLRKS